MGFGGYQTNSDDCAYLSHEGVVRRTRDAMCYQIRGDHVWFPRKHVLGESETLVIVPVWVARQKGLQSDW